MSQDFALAWQCPHITIEEVVPLNSLDRRSLFTRQPIGSSGSVRITANDTIFLPQSGTFSQAILHNRTSGPFEINESENVLAITTSELAKGDSYEVWDVQETDLITIPVKNKGRFSVESMVKILDTGIKNSHVEIKSENGHLVLTNTKAVGPEAVVRVGGPAAKLLGFDYQKVAYGRELYPSWSIHDRAEEDKIDAASVSRYIKFNTPVKNNPVFKVTYSVPSNRCLRCQGGHVENDIRFNNRGQAFMVENEDLLQQAALKIILTDKGSNPHHPWYGTNLKSYIGTKVVAGITALISEDVRQALAKLQNLQESQTKFQQVSYKERLYSIISVDVKPHVQNNMAFLISVTVQNASGEPINLTTVFTVPSVTALMGSNGLMMMGRQ